METATFGNFSGCKISEDGNIITLLFEGGRLDLPFQDAKKILPSLHQSLSAAEKKRIPDPHAEVMAGYPTTVELGLANQEVSLRFDKGLPHEHFYLLNKNLSDGLFVQLAEITRILNNKNKQLHH